MMRIGQHEQHTPTVETPNPALVTEREAQRLPRPWLLLLCAVYVLPGLFGRDPWKAADITAFGYMQSIAEGRSPWLAPTVGGLPSESALLPYWLGAAAIKALGPWVGAPIAARLAFALLLALVLVLTWYATYHLARTEAAQPLPLAFGGEAHPVDYARAVADGALLALIASLGLLQLGHETTPELVQLFAAALYLFGLTLSSFRPLSAGLVVLAALPMLVASGAPSVAMALGAVGIVASGRSDIGQARLLARWLGASLLLAAALATATDAWVWRAHGIQTLQQAGSVLRQLLWFTWPSWPLALWTLWRWRRQLQRRHISVPLGCATVGVAACIVMGSSDRALMLSLPALAVLAAFALPTLQRGTAAAMDWFSLFFFTGAAIALWVVYLSLQTGLPAKPAANVMKLAPGYPVSFSATALAIALAGTLAWFALVRWRTARHRHPLWKSLVLPAAGVALCWLLAMTLMLPLADYARSYRVQIARIAAHVPRGSCVFTRDLPRAQLAALEHFGGFRPDAKAPLSTPGCDHLLVMETRQKPRRNWPGWEYVATARRPTDREEATAIFRRVRPTGG
jgi:4-amino-4-deoxy-L-arabinose transferase-like glycosyltransferase